MRPDLIQHIERHAAQCAVGENLESARWDLARLRDNIASVRRKTEEAEAALASARAYAAEMTAHWQACIPAVEAEIERLTLPKSP